ncbi:MAG: hypothetical protein RIS99_316 [Bacteroidota bacterium]|jgi:hypothetical protein
MKKIILFLAFLSVGLPSFSQDDPFKELDLEVPVEKVKAGFKTTRVMNGHSFENVAKGVLDFKINHRFGTLNGGFYDLFGLDQAYQKMSFDYGVTDRFMVGVGRASFGKVYDAFGKYKILWQTSDNKMPVSLLYYTSINVKTLKWQDPNRENYFPSRLAYTHQLILGRKFNENFSMQLSPTLVHRNLVATKAEKNDVFALGFSGRQKLSNRLAFTWEYFLVPKGQLASNFKNSLSLGFDIETGGHVFQVHFTNSTSMVDQGFICETTNSWGNGGVHFGFNVSRVFNVGR